MSINTLDRDIDPNLAMREDQENSANIARKYLELITDLDIMLNVMSQLVRFTLSTCEDTGVWFAILLLRPIVVQRSMLELNTMTCSTAS